MKQPQLTEDQVREFVRELSKLARRHKIAIGGCGCCGSPFLYAMGKNTSGRFEVNGTNFDELRWKTDDES